MHYLLSKVGKDNKYKITFHNNLGITYGSVTVFTDSNDFSTVIVSTSDYAKCSELINTVTDGSKYAYVTKHNDTFKPVYNSSDKPKYLKFAVNSYFKATAKWLRPQVSAGG